MNVSGITPYLYVGSRPTTNEHYNFLRHVLSIDLIINMTQEANPQPNALGLDIPVLHIPTRDQWPLRLPLVALVEGVDRALVMIHGEQKIYVHCKVGRHRSVAMAASILIAMGRSADEAMELISTSRDVAHPEAWHIKRSIQRFEQYWLNEK